MTIRFTEGIGWSRLSYEEEKYYKSCLKEMAGDFIYTLETAAYYHPSLEHLWVRDTMCKIERDFEMLFGVSK